MEQSKTTEQLNAKFQTPFRIYNAIEPHLPGLLGISDERATELSQKGEKLADGIVDFITGENKEGDYSYEHILSELADICDNSNEMVFLTLIVFKQVGHKEGHLCERSKVELTGSLKEVFESEGFQKEIERLIKEAQIGRHASNDSKLP